MFYEDFELHPKDTDPSAEYIEDFAKIVYYMPHIYNFDSLNETIVHEWLHGLIQWATDDIDWTAESDHWLMRNIGFE